jgi:hypothetical protein
LVKEILPATGRSVKVESAKLEHQAEEDRRSPHEPALRAIEEVRTRLDKLERVLREPPPAPWAGSDATRGIGQAGAPPAAD